MLHAVLITPSSCRRVGRAAEQTRLTRDWQSQDPNSGLLNPVSGRDQQLSLGDALAGTQEG